MGALAFAVVLRVGVAPPQASFEQALPPRQESRAPRRVGDRDEAEAEMESRQMRPDPAGRPERADLASERESAVSLDSPQAAARMPQASVPVDSQLSTLEQNMTKEPAARLDLGPRAADPSAAVVGDDRQPAAKTVLRRSASVPESMSEAAPEIAVMMDDPVAATTAAVAPTTEEAEADFAAGSESADDPTAGLTALSAEAPDGQDALRMDTVTVTGSSSRGAPWRNDLESWLAHIDALIDAGDEDGAAEELAEFVEAWPDHELDERYEPWLPAIAPTRE